MKSLATRIALLIFTLTAAHGAQALAQDKARQPPAEELARTLAAQDAALFDSFNRCEFEKFAAFFVEDVEFYHDKGGVTLSRKAVVESVRNNICGKVRREAVADSFEAYPIPGFGAVQTGAHRFYELGAKPGSGPAGEARFVHLWQYKDGAWKITRVISYDHGPAHK